MLVALFIDSVDGSLARAVGVATVLPNFDGRRLDDMVDFFNYVLVPAVCLVVAGSLVHPAIASAPILASAYGFSQRAAKTDDHFFLGFPSYWNVLALYLWLLEIPPTVGTFLTLALSIGVFVPLKYIHPSQLSVLFRTTLALSALWMLAMTWCVLDPARARDSFAIELSLAYPAYYVALSAVLGRWLRPTRRRRSR
jgi:phosphatidylcholine synthase